MLEMTGIVNSWKCVHLAYIARNSSSVSTATLPADASWLVGLKQYPWLFDLAGKGPYRADDILANWDASRPNAPVAKLVEGFAVLAGQLDLSFGRAIPNAPATERLRTFGPSASWPDLQDLMQDALTEARGGPESLTLLRSVLNTTPLFALPDGRTTPDDLRRVPAW